ncbi:VOC family protein [Pseudonocardia bannensis]|uniref:VOC family protein n=1 Tax=Pseudonocardia bannensis TaxID=630973 RepID=A0A848DPG8_9PSEU|nr:VOC family protein [Pseudonocardia bannensis]NMH94234.1 VOC family protein [Pseudonocardia bannensis]
MTDILDLYPRLVVDDGDGACAFYAAALGAETIERYTDPDGRIVHAMLRAGPIRFAVKDADGYDPAPATGGVSVIMALYVSDADAVADRMVAAGATVVFPVADQPYGERGGRLSDPYGHLWMIAQQTERLTPEQIQTRTDAMYEQA